MWRFNADTTNDRNATKVRSYFIMNYSHDFMEIMGRAEKIEYFKAGIDFLKQEYTIYSVVDSRVDYNEKVCTLPCCSFMRKRTAVNPLMLARDYF